MFKAMWKNWKSAGYWSEVVVEYSKLTGLNLEQMAKATKNEHLLDHFCQKASDMSLSAKSCAKVIFDHGFHDVGDLSSKKPTIIDGFAGSIYGKPSRKKEADLLEASRIACEKLLCELIEYSDVHVLAKKLFDGPMPYSTHDLAVSVSLNFFRDADLFDDLKEAQIAARLQVAQWAREGKVVVPLAQAFEEVLYKLYKPLLAASAAKSDIQTPMIDDTIDTEFEEILENLRVANKGATPQNAAKTVKDIMAWQYNVLMGQKLDDDFLPKANAVEIEKAFFYGLATMALESYDLPDQGVLFMKNVICGFYAITDSDAILLRFEEMREAADVYQDAFQMGCGLMVGYLVSGKDENEQYVLTELIRR